MDSREKVMRLKDYLLSLKPEDEEMAQQLQLAASFAPLVIKAIPQDPVEVDRYLRTTAWAAAKCRSDDAPQIGVFELVNERWVPVDVELEAAP